MYKARNACTIAYTYTGVKYARILLLHTLDAFTESEIAHENLTKRTGSEHQSKRPSSSLSLQSSSSK